MDDFDDTTTALGAPDEPVSVVQFDELEQAIIDVINNYDYPITAAFITGYVGETKSNINKKLYALKRRNIVEQLVCTPPLWRLI